MVFNKWFGIPMCLFQLMIGNILAIDDLFIFCQLYVIFIFLKYFNFSILS